METPRVPVVWLAYVSYPITTAVYFERALRRNCRVVTMGPKIGPDIIKAWSLENLKLPVVDQDVPLPSEPDMREVTPAVRERFTEPDLYLWIESVPGHFPKNLDALRCPKACYLIDSHLNLEWHVKWGQFFDHVFIAQREYVPEFRRRGCRNVHWLPLGCDPEVHARKTSEKKYDVGFVGSVFVNTPRAELLKKLSEKRLLLRVERCFWDEMALVFSQSRIVFNNAIRNDLNMRVFEALATGSFLLTDLPANSGQDELFAEGEDLGIYQPATLLDQVRYYLVREEEREHIARRGQALVHKAHTYSHRCAELLQVALHGQATTPSAGEWRERAIAGLSSTRKFAPKTPSSPPGRSFIIPVVDASPEGRQELDALLTDLAQIEGEVIVIFNSPDAWEAFRTHPRIDLSARLNVNAGVARAWNMGVHLSSEPTLFFLNADLRVTREAVEGLQKALWELPSAAVVGPEGSFFGFYTYEDILWLHREARPSSPQFVDAVSGFLFATKRELFRRRLLQFEDDYTPCFTEEWDLGLQVRQAGYRCYVVPVEGYSHEWGISVQHDRVIEYMKGKRAVSAEILARNRVRFWRKWLQIGGEIRLPAWEPNPPEQPPALGAALLESRVIELTDQLAQQARPENEPRVSLIEHRDYFPHILNFLGLVGEGVEVGVKAGQYSEHLLKHWTGKRLYSVDPWREWNNEFYQDSANVPQTEHDRFFLEATRRLAPFAERSAILRTTSAEAAGKFSDRSLDFVYIDAQHHYEAIKEDIRLWFPKVRRGGILSGDDYRGGVQKAVNEFLIQQRWRRLIVSGKDDSWFLPIL